MRIDVRGALRNFTESEWRNCVTDKDGRTLTPKEVYDEFLEELAKGHDYIPMGDCDNFDFKTGCLGHPVETGEAEG
jgi:hypothetical protein